LLAGSNFISQTPEPTHGKYWRLTDSETLWTGRYGNCDYGYFLWLPVGIVAHGNLPLAPNHGVGVPLPDTGRTSAFQDHEDRYVWVDAHYNVVDDDSLTAVARTELRNLNKSEGKGKAHFIRRIRTRLSGVSAIEAETEFHSSGRTIVTVNVVTLRSGIVYTAGLRTMREYRDEDQNEFRAILSGFKMIPLPHGECSNDE